MNTILQDLRFGIRMLLKTPVVSGVAALSLALGIGAASGMFALCSSFWLEPLPFGNQDRLLLLGELRHGEPTEFSAGASGLNFRDWREASTTISSMAAFESTRVNVTGVDMPEEILVASGTPNMFEVMQAQPSIGRMFRSEEGAEGARNVVVITHRYWASGFDTQPDILGQSLTLNGTPHTIVGVMAEDFEMMPTPVSAFRPTDLSDENRRSRKDWTVFGRLESGTTVEQARAEIASIHARLETEYPDDNRGWGVRVQKIRKWFPGPTDTKLILVLVAVSLFGVAIACANVANLLLSRAETRMKEIAVRTALGAGQARILRQLLTESVLQGLAGGGLGTVFSLFIIRGLNGAMPAELPEAFRPTLDIPTLLITVAIAVGAGILFGLAPALHASRGNLKEALGDGARGGTASRKRKRLRNVFVTGQIAIALALLTGAGELRDIMNSVAFAENGFNAEGVLTFQVALPEYKYENSDAVRLVKEEMVRELGGIAGVETVTSMGGLPRGRSIPNSFYGVEGREYPDPNQRPRTNWDAVTPGFLEVLEVPLVSGRWFEDGDRDDTPRVAVVNQELVRRAFPDQEPIGERIELQGETWEIVGVMGNYMQQRIPFDGFTETAILVPSAQLPFRNAAFAIRTTGDPLALAPDVRRVVWSVDPDQPIVQMQTLENFIEVELAAPQFLGVFVGALGGLAMFLSAIGIYGVMAHGVIQERREMGIRLAVGARGGQLVGMVTRRGLKLTAIGFVLGAPLAYLIHRAVLSSLSLFDAEPGMNMGVVAGILLGAVAILATYLPARSAAKVHPTRALSLE